MGNDVVDLKACGSAGRSKDVRFVSKVLTEREKTVLSRAENPDFCLWAMWASKEASYKVISRNIPSVSSSPRRYEVVFEEKSDHRAWAGKVVTPCGHVSVRVYLGQNYVHSIAQTGLWPQDDNDLVSRVFQIVSGAKKDAEPCYQQQSESVRRAAASAIAGLLKIDQEHVIIKRSRSSTGSGPPVAHLREINQEIPLSLSHHGCFGAFAFNARNALFF